MDHLVSCVNLNTAPRSGAGQWTSRRWPLEVACHGECGAVIYAPLLRRHAACWLAWRLCVAASHVAPRLIQSSLGLGDWRLLRCSAWCANPVLASCRSAQRTRSWRRTRSVHDFRKSVQRCGDALMSLIQKRPRTLQTPPTEMRTPRGRRQIAVRLQAVICLYRDRLYVHFVLSGFANEPARVGLGGHGDLTCHGRRPLRDGPGLSRLQHNRFDARQRRPDVPAAATDAGGHGRGVGPGT